MTKRLPVILWAICGMIILPPLRPYWRNWPATFDFVLRIDFSRAPKPALEQLRWLASGSFFEIYRVVRQ